MLIAVGKMLNCTR